MIGLGTIINVDAEKTRQYDQAMGPGEPCSCNDCKNYCARVKAAYPAAAEYLAGRLKSRWKHPHWNPVRTE